MNSFIDSHSLSVVSHGMAMRRSRGQLNNSYEKIHVCKYFIIHSISDSYSKESVCNAGELGSFPGSGRSPGKRNGYPLQNSRDRGVWHAAVHGVAKESDTTEQITFLLFFTVIINVLIFYWRNRSGILIVFVSQDLCWFVLPAHMSFLKIPDSWIVSDYLFK